MARVSCEIRPLSIEGLALLDSHIQRKWDLSKRNRERFARQLDGKGVYLIAWSDNAPVGHLWLKWEGATDDQLGSKLDKCADIEDLFVNPGSRSKGIGSQLLEQAECLASQKGFSKIGLGVSVENSRARSVYGRQGYEDSGLGEHTTCGRLIDRSGQAQSWEGRSIYLIKQL